jgi:hypothetical protein
MDLSSHRHDVARALTELETRLTRLVAALAHSPASAELEPSDAAGSALRRACEAYSAIDYRMEDAVGESVTCVGVIGAGAQVLRLAVSVNVAKAALKNVCAPLQGIRIRVPVKGGASPTKAIPVIRVLLRQIQRSDLNLLAAYRKVPVLSAPPASITFTRAHTRSVYRKAIGEIDDMLVNLGGPTAVADRDRLTTLDRRETHLALAKEHYRNIRANVVYARLDQRGRGRIQIAAELPILYCAGRHAGAPEIRFPPTIEPEALQRKRQSKLEAHPFLESLPVYRYMRSA